MQMLIIFCGYFSPAFEKHGRSSVTVPQGQLLPHLPHPLNMRQKGCSDCSRWNTVGKCLGSYIPCRSSYSGFGNAGKWLCWLQGVCCSCVSPSQRPRVAQQPLHTCCTYSVQIRLRIFPLPHLHCRAEQGHPDHSLQLSLQLWSTWSSPASEVDKTKWKAPEQWAPCSWSSRAIRLLFPLAPWEADARYLVMQEREFGVLWGILLPQKLEEIWLKGLIMASSGDPSQNPS